MGADRAPTRWARFAPLHSFTCLRSAATLGAESGHVEAVDVREAADERLRHSVDLQPGQQPRGATSEQANKRTRGDVRVTDVSRARMATNWSSTTRMAPRTHKRLGRTAIPQCGGVHRSNVPTQSRPQRPTKREHTLIVVRRHCGAIALPEPRFGGSCAWASRTPRTNQRQPQFQRAQSRERLPTSGELTNTH